MPVVPYQNYLDTEATLMLEYGFKNFDFSGAIQHLFQLDHPAADRPFTPDVLRGYFERLRRLFALYTVDDDLLRDFVAKENEHLARAIAVYGKLTILPVLTTDEPTLALLLAALRIDIWTELETAYDP